MNTVALAAGTKLPDATAREGTCYHCGEALGQSPVSQRVEQAMRGFCCTGCAAAAQWIHTANLDDYYALRSQPAGRAAAEQSDLAAWDRQDVMAPYQRAVPGGCEVVLLTDGMRCAACAWLIDRALAREPGVREVVANAVTGRIRLVWNPATSRLSAILRRLISLGYRPYLAGGREEEAARRAETRRWVLRVGLAGIATLQAMMFAEALYLDPLHQMPESTRDFFRWLTFLLATPVVFYAGFPFLAGAWRELSERRAGLDVLVSAATLLAWGASTLETLRGGAHVWFDAAVMFVFLLLAARMIELRARRVAMARVDALARAVPVLADLERADGALEAVAVSQLVEGDVVRVAAGAGVPADARLLESSASFDESLLTGESRPVAHAPGDAVLAGSVPVDRAVRVSVTASGAATQLSALLRLVQRAQEHRPRMARAADRIASWFVLGLTAVTIATYIAWRSHDASRAFEVALALLVISCPCALALAVPAALAAAHSRLSRLGILVCRPDALETLARIDTCVFDKTGTLSDGAWHVRDVQTFGQVTTAEALCIAAALERGSQHPLATAFRTHDDGREATLASQQAGFGIAARVGGRELRLGIAAFAAGRADDGALWLGDGSSALARFEMEETPRADAGPALAGLRAQGLTLHLLSGDSTDAVAHCVESLHAPFASHAARQLPQDKLARVRELQSQGHRVAMVGDGINDAPVLAGADVSIAVAGGTALAQRSADVVLLRPDLGSIAAAIDTARRTRRIIRQNLAWAVGYNLVALPLAAAGLVVPWMAALAMVLSSLTVTLNALRLARVTTA
ncbi:MAG: cadmium-translocating P-type ATPase [Proteobacteria bacterium]|nr:cadmium-translocating P-type ATPase [Pseudomonadota bacterium]